MSGFKREQRYLVFKLKALTEKQITELATVIQLNEIPPAPECVVVEHDWPNYEKVWADIKAMATGEYPK